MLTQNKGKITPKLASKRYMRSMLGFSLGYAGALIGVTYLLKTIGNAPLLYILLATILPGLFLFGMLWSIWRFLREVDEVARHFIVQSMIIGLFGVLALSGVWGLMELLSDEIPRLPVFWIFPVFFAAFGFAACFGPGRGMGLK